MMDKFLGQLLDSLGALFILLLVMFVTLAAVLAALNVATALIHILGGGL